MMQLCIRTIRWASISQSKKITHYSAPQTNPSSDMQTPTPPDKLPLVVMLFQTSHRIHHLFFPLQCLPCFFYPVAAYTHQIIYSAATISMDIHRESGPSSEGDGSHLAFMTCLARTASYSLTHFLQTSLRFAGSTILTRIKKMPLTGLWSLALTSQRRYSICLIFPSPR
jgi:hypothetical protein